MVEAFFATPMVIWNVQKTLVASNTFVEMLLSKYVDRYTFFPKIKHIEGKKIGCLEICTYVQYPKMNMIPLKFEHSGWVYTEKWWSLGGPS